MAELFKNKYRTKSIRLKDWDYSQNGYYYVTICTKNRECIFGKIVDGKIILSELGGIVNKYWREIPKHFKNIFLDEYVIMPNHIHGIIIIDNDVKSNVETPHWGVSTTLKRNPHHIPQWKPNSLGSIICQFKTICTKQIRSIGYRNFAWQSRFYEEIIQNEHRLNTIRDYIINNPLQWKLNENNPTN